MVRYFPDETVWLVVVDSRHRTPRHTKNRGTVQLRQGNTLTKSLLDDATSPMVCTLGGDISPPICHCIGSTSPSCIPHLPAIYLLGYTVSIHDNRIHTCFSGEIASIQDSRNMVLGCWNWMSQEQYRGRRSCPKCHFRHRFGSTERFHRHP